MRMGSFALVLGSVACGDAVGPVDTGRPVNLGLEDIVFETATGQRVPAQRGRLWLGAIEGVSGLSVSFVRLPATADGAGPPIIYLAGGPGGSGIATGRGERFEYFQELRSLGDVILYDQRGTGISTPALACNRNFALPVDRAVDRTEAAAMWSGQVQVCANELRGRDIPLDDYNTERNADDIEALRVALGVPQFVVIGYSYGTHLALDYIRRYGDRVAQAVLHGVEGPNHTLKLPSNVQRQIATIDSLVEEHPRRNELGPFAETLRHILASLDAKSESVFVDDSLVVFGKFEAQVLVSNAIGDREEIEELPGIVQLIAEAGWAPAGPAVLELKRAFMNSGMSYAMDCASGVTAPRAMQIASESPATILGDAINFPFPEICDAWDVPDLGDQFRSHVQSAVPVLLVSGSVDGRTPASNALEIATGFPNHRHLLVEFGGHNDLATTSPVIDAIVSFLAGRPDVPAMVSLSTLQFRTF